MPKARVQRSYYVDQALARDLKIEAARRGITQTALVERAIREYLGRLREADAKRERELIEEHALYQG